VDFKYEISGVTLISQLHDTFTYRTVYDLAKLIKKLCKLK